MATQHAAQDEIAGTPLTIGVAEDALREEVELLNRILADEAILHMKARNFHWNVTGPRFHDLHVFFEKIYREQGEILDEVAERARQLGGRAIGTFDEVQGLARLKEEPGDVPDADAMVGTLLGDHEALVRQLRQDANRAEKLGDMATNDFLIGLVEKHEKTAWMLRATLGRP